MTTVPARRAVLSIRWIATSIAVVLTVGAVLGVGAIAERNARTALTREIEARLRLQARSLAASSTSALLSDFPELTLHPLVKGMQAQQPELDLLVVVDHRNRVQGHADARLLGTAFTAPAGLGETGRLDPLSPAEFLQAAGPLVVARAPVLHAGGQVIGAVYVGLPQRYIDLAAQAARRQQALLLALLVALGAACAFVLMSQLLRPIGALRAGLERIGRGDLETPIRLGDRTELGLLAGTVNDMASALKGAQAEMLERERLAHEVDLARQIQASLLPSRELKAGPFDIRGDHRAAAEVGGDYWDVLPLPDGRIGLAVADVAGKGLAGCLVMSMLSALLRAYRASHTSPAAMLAVLDERLSESLRPGVFVTMWYGVLDPESGQLTFASAGHNPLVVWRREAEDLELYASKGIPIGAIRGGAIRATLREETVRLEPGDVCVQYTDGYTEAFQAESGEQFGPERLEQAVRDHAAGRGEAVLEALRSAVRSWAGDRAPDDDETLLVITCDRDAAAFRRTAPAETADQVELRDALARLARAEATGAGLQLDARLDCLRALDGWLQSQPELAGLPGGEREILRAALYEACANIVEHGYGENGLPGLQLWWLPDARSSRGDADARCRGEFVLRDAGRPFRVYDRKPTDFGDPAVRSRGRGIGLEIIHRAVADIAYHPATERGNITILVVRPGQAETATEGAAA